jgi:hypothetical protein
LPPFGFLLADALFAGDLYRTLDLPGSSTLRDAQGALDAAVRKVYGMSPKEEPLQFFYELNQDYAMREASGKPVPAPGLPSVFSQNKTFYSSDYFPCPVLG